MKTTPFGILFLSQLYTMYPFSIESFLLFTGSSYKFPIKYSEICGYNMAKGENVLEYE